MHDVRELNRGVMANDLRTLHEGHLTMRKLVTLFVESAIWLALLSGVAYALKVIWS